MSKYWFRKRKGLKSKDLGWGYVPISREGNLFCVVLILFIVLSGFYFSIYCSPTLLQGIYFLITLFITMVIFCLFANTKTKRDIKSKLRSGFKSKNKSKKSKKK